MFMYQSYPDQQNKFGGRISALEVGKASMGDRVWQSSLAGGRPEGVGRSGAGQPSPDQGKKTKGGNRGNLGGEEPSGQFSSIGETVVGTKDNQREEVDKKRPCLG